MTTDYVAFIADVRASRHLGARQRAALQADLSATAREFNARYRKQLAARFAVTLGDELQGLFANADPVWEVSHALRARFPAAEWIVACARGALSTPLRPGATAPELDGPCFHAARAALAEAKTQGLVLALAGFDPALSGCAAYYAALYRGWTTRQRALATAQRAHPEARLEALSRLLRASPSSISHLRRRMGWPLVAAGDKVFQELLSS
jgi:hypothetical protein